MTRFHHIAGTTPREFSPEMAAKGVADGYLLPADQARPEITGTVELPDLSQVKTPAGVHFRVAEHQLISLGYIWYKGQVWVRGSWNLAPAALTKTGLCRLAAFHGLV